MALTDFIVVNVAGMFCKMMNSNSIYFFLWTLFSYPNSQNYE